MAGVRYIHYNEEELPVKIGYYAIRRLREEYGAGMEDTKNDLSLYEPLLFYALEKGHKMDGKKLKYKKSDMEDILEECLFEFLMLIPQFFPDGSELLEKTMGEEVRRAMNEKNSTTTESVERPAPISRSRRRSSKT